MVVGIAVIGDIDVTDFIDVTALDDIDAVDVFYVIEEMKIFMSWMM